MINNGALQDSEISAYMEKQLSDSDVSALIKKVQNELDQAQQSDPSLEEFLNGLGGGSRCVNRGRRWHDAYCFGGM